MSSGSSPLPRWVNTFIPNKEVKVTPVILSLNVLVWLIMVLKGINPLTPDMEDVMKWGATSTESVTSGEYWRLFTSNYLHYGIIHLAVNMLSLNNIGRMLEQFIGWWRFLLLYTFTGICASAVSIWWNPFGVGVGASGAILGLVGILLAILTTNLIEKTIRMKMLRSMGISAALMIFISMQANVDNAAHLGGLAAGMIGGYCIYPELRAHYFQRKKQFMGLVAALCIIAGAIGWFVSQATPVAMRTVQQMLSDFENKERVAEENFQLQKYTTAESIDKNVVEVYRFGIRQLDTIQELDLNEQAVAQFAKLRVYFTARLKYYEFVSQSLQADNIPFDDSVALWKRKSEEAREALNKQ